MYRAARLALLLEDAAVQHCHVAAREARALIEAVHILSDEKLEVAESLELDEPRSGLYVPAGHWTHCPMLLAPVTGWKKPAGHCSGLTLPVGA